MTFRVLVVALGLSSLPLTGCGTVANLLAPCAGSGGLGTPYKACPDECAMVPFGGVKRDLACLRSETAGNPGCCPVCGADCERCGHGPFKLFCALDLPVSLVGDAATWPYVVAFRWVNEPIPVPPLTQAHLIQVASPPSKPQMLPAPETLPIPDRTAPKDPEPQ